MTFDRVGEDRSTPNILTWALGTKRVGKHGKHKYNSHIIIIKWSTHEYTWKIKSC